MRDSCLPIIFRRIRLRRLCEGDAEAFQTYRNDPEVARYQSWAAMTKPQVREFLRAVNTDPLLMPGDWCQIAIAEVGNDTLIGDIGICVAEDRSEAEIGFSMAPDAQGKGLASEAVTAAIGWIFDQTPVRQVIGIADARNGASIRLLQRIGMVETGQTQADFRGERVTEITYVLPRATWRGLAR